MTGTNGAKKIEAGERREMDSEPDIYRPVLVDSVRARLKAFAKAERRSMQNAANWGLAEFLRSKGY